MTKFFLILLFSVLSFLSSAQTLDIKGKLADKDGTPITNATVYLLKEKDSSIVNYSSSGTEGNFTLKLDPLPEPSLLKIDADKFLSFTRKFDGIDKSIDLGNLLLEKDSAFTIEGVNIIASPVRIKNDTIEFNANAIKVRPDSKVEELLRQIPGLEISNDGKITANGKEVDQVMINGKPFFDKEGKIILQNLPADIIRKVQITTTKTDEERARGRKATSDKATLNLTIDDKQNKGLISRVTAGIGTDKRYEASGLASYFNKDMRVSLLASSNNINVTGFSYDEVFDSMGRGRGSMLMQGQNYRVRGNTSYQFESRAKGIQRSSMVGVSYQDKLAKEADVETLSGVFLDNNLETRSKVARTTLLPDYVLDTKSESNGNTDSRQYNFDSSFRIRPDSLTTIFYSPSYAHSEGLAVSRSKSATSRDAVLLNTADNYRRNESTGDTFNSRFFIARRLAKKGRSINVSINNFYELNKDRNLNISNTLFFQNSQPDDLRNQQIRNASRSSQLYYSLGYSEPITDSSSIDIKIAYELNKDLDWRNVNDFDNASGQYSIYNSLLSNTMDRKHVEMGPEISYNINKKKFDLWLSGGVNFNKINVDSYYNSQNYLLEKDFIAPTTNLNFSYKFAERMRLGIYNFTYTNIPTAYQLTPYEDLSNPLVIYRGNPELKPELSNYTGVNFNNFNMVKNFNYYFNLSFQYRQNSVTDYSYYDSSGRQFITFTNISGNKTANFSGGFSKTYKWKTDHKLTISPRLSYFFNYNRGFVDGQQYSSTGNNFSPSLSLSYELKDRITAKPSYSVNYQHTNYTNYRIDEANFSSQNFKLELTNYFLNSNLVIGNDFTYTTNSNIAPGFKKDFYFWNTSIGYSFLNKQLTAKVKVYDVLNQNQAVTKIIGPTYVEDREDLILKRYLMFSMSYKLNKFDGKKPRNNPRAQ